MTHRAWTAVLTACLGTLPLAAHPAPADSGHPAPVAPLSTVLRDRQGRNVGLVVVTETPHGLLLHVSLDGIPAGAHAIHIHETGKCEPPFATAGGHFNPGHKAHGILDPAGLHAGDLPNLVVPESGRLEVDVFAEGLSLSPGPNSVLDADGSSVIIHARADDYRTQPSGDSGDRIACGVLAR